MTGFKRILVFSLFIAAGAALFAQMNPRLGILPFTGGEANEGETIALLFSYEPELAQAFTVIPRISTAEAVMGESQFHQATGLTDVDTIVRLGRPFSLDYIMAGHIRSLGEKKLLLITIFQTARFRLIAGTYQVYRDIKEIQAMIPDIIRQLTAASKNNAPFYTPRLVILPVIASPEIDRDDTKLLAHILATEIANSGQYSVQPREGAVQTIMTEQRIKHAAAADPANVQVIGRALNVQQVLSGDVRFFDENKLFSASILNTADASQRAGGAISYQSVTDGMELMKELESILAPAPPASPAAVPPPPVITDSTEDSPAPGIVPHPAMVPVEGGAFQMGSRYSAGERPVHTVVVDSFYIGNTEVTQEEWMEVMEDNPSYFKGGLLPVENISWYDAVEYCNKRSLKEGFVPAYQERGDTIVCDFTASGYRLPTEAEWEYAARWGDNRDLSFIYTGEQNVNTVGWFAMNSRESTRSVMTKSPNNLGLYDMSGNVYEWCWDWYENYATAGQENPTGPASGVFRVIRGGGWLSTETGLRFTGRSGEFPATRNNYTGLRVVRRGPAPVEK